MNSKNIILFGGTTEGRLLAEYLNELNIRCLLCVATDYGQEILPEMEYIRVRCERLDEVQIKTLFAEENAHLVIDATHPYADIVTKNIKIAAKSADVRYLRLLRDAAAPRHPDALTYFDDVNAAASYLDGRSGNILFTCGLKELPDFARNISDLSRIYARVLLREDVFEICEKTGLSKRQIICMQGPFSKDLNAAMIRQLDAKYIVTKESGKAGGFAEKADAAYETGAKCLCIRRPQAMEEGLSLEEVKEYIEKEYAIDRRRSVTLIGTGMGDPLDMTVEAHDACRDCGCIIGADRMLKTLAGFQKPMVSMYKSDEILSYIDEHPCYKDIVIALSGDPSFYSGAKNILEKLKDTEIEVKVLPGISCVSYLCAKLNISWDDMKIVSLHGRKDNLISAVYYNKKVFALASYAQSIREMAAELTYYGLGNCRMYVGCDLSYDTEQILEGTPADLLEFNENGICCAIIENENAGRLRYVPGIPDDAFIRGKTPMTKEEVRSIAISKLSPGPSSVIYDLGAGTGSVSAECARIATDGRIYAVEMKADAIKLLKENKRKFAVSNMEIIEGRAPEALLPLPAPTHAFIGGSGGELKNIVSLLLEKNPKVRIAITCVTMETLDEAFKIMQSRPELNGEAISVNISKTRPSNGYHMMAANNPVFIVTLNAK